MKWTKYGFEFLSIFIAVLSAFALNSWSDARKDRVAAEKILLEIRRGLDKDLEDMRLNMAGHERGLEAVTYWRQALLQQPIDTTAVAIQLMSLTRDFITMQNGSGYGSLKNRGLELVTDDSLRSDIITLYEFDMMVLKKLEEDYAEMEYHQSYYAEFNTALAPYVRFDAKGTPSSLHTPIVLPAAERDRLLVLLWKLDINRRFVLHYYTEVEKRIRAVQAHIVRVLE